MYMFKYVMKRIGLMLMTFSIIMVISFVLIKLLPFNPPPGISDGHKLLIQQFEERGYYDPVLVQLWNYVKRIVLEWDWGIGVTMASYRNWDVWETFVTLLPPTILLNVYSSLFAVPLGLLLGIYAALRKNKWQDHVISTGVMVFISVPGYVTAFLLQYFLCFRLGLFDLTLESGTDYFSWEMFQSMIPPILAMSFGSIAGYCRFTRAELTEVLTSEYLLLARTKGLTKRQSIFRHALRNAMVPIFPMIIGEFISVLSGSLIIEGIYGIPGVGRLFLDSVTYQDYDFFMLLSAFYTFIGLAAGIVIDLSYGFIDPRIRMGAK